MRKIGTILLIVLFLVLIFLQKNATGESLPVSGPGESDYPSIYPGQLQMPGGISLPEITKEQAENLERLLKMPTGKMNDDIYVEIMMQISCLASINKKIDEAKIAEIARPYGVTGEEWTAYHLQMLNEPIKWTELLDERTEEMNRKFEALKKNNCQPKIKLPGVEDKEEVEDKKEEISPSAEMTDDIWLEITARIKCIDRIALIFTKDEIKTIFEPFGVAPVEYQTYTEDILKRMEEVLKKSDEKWTEEDQALAGLSEKLKQRIEELKKNNCVLEDGTPISRDYNAPMEEPEGWDKTKCKLFFCDNCYKVTEDSSWWAKYRCKNLCAGCPSFPPPPPVEDCLGFCQGESCPAYADKITGQCAPQKKCHRCWIFAKCCEEVPSVCCLTRPPEVCQGFCGLKSCPEGTVSQGEKNCPSGKECHRCWIIAKCCEKVPGVCCVSQ